MEGDMYNIAITKEKKTEFFNGNDAKPRSYPNLAEALISAQYLGLTKQDVELHFVKEGTSIDAVTQTTSSIEDTAKKVSAEKPKKNDTPVPETGDNGAGTVPPTGDGSPDVPADTGTDGDPR